MKKVLDDMAKIKTRVSYRGKKGRVPSAKVELQKQWNKSRGKKGKKGNTMVEWRKKQMGKSTNRGGGNIKVQQLALQNGKIHEKTKGYKKQQTHQK